MLRGWWLGILLIVVPVLGVARQTPAVAAGTTARLDRSSGNGLVLTVNMRSNLALLLTMGVDQPRKYKISNLQGPTPNGQQICQLTSIDISCGLQETTQGTVQVKFDTTPRLPDETKITVGVGYHGEPVGFLDSVYLCGPGSNRVITSKDSCASAKVQSVTVKGTPVVADREGLDPLTIAQESKGACDKGAASAEWVDCPTPDGTPDRVWPVIVARSTTLTFQQVRLSGLNVPPNVDPVLTGTIDLGNGSKGYVLSSTGTVESGASGKSTVVFQNVSTSPALPDTVGLLHATITWSVRADGNIYVPAGTSSIPLYVVYADPVYTIPKADPSTYLSAVDISTTAASGQSSESGVVSAVWNAFKTLKLQPRSLDPATGNVSTSSTVLKYFEPWTLELMLTNQYQQLCLGVHGPLPLLQDGVGRCGTWADFFVAALNAQGIQADSVSVNDQSGFPCGPVCDQGREFMLIKSWHFHGKGTGDAPFPYQDTYRVVNKKSATAVKVEFEYPVQTRAQGGVTSPPGMFVVGDHVVVKYGGSLYDPAYGTGPFGDIKAWAKASLAGYMVYDGKHLKGHKILYILRAHKGVCSTPCST